MNSGNGPKECERACYLYSRELLKEFDLQVISENYSDKDCLKSIVFYSEDDVSYLEGTVQWICESPYRKHHKRKNWFINVSILQEEIQLDNQKDIRYDIFRSGGKGGQNVNKVSTAIRATHIPTGISVIAMDQRSQLQNKKIAYMRLMKKLEDMKMIENNEIQYSNWNKHNHIIRGLPYRTYKGLQFRRMK